MKARDTNIKVANEKAARVPRAPIRSGVGTVPVQVREETVIKKGSSSSPSNLQLISLT